MAELLSDADLRSNQQLLLRWIENNPQKKLSFLVTGKTGVGKSRLVNALVGKDVAVEGRQRDSCTNTSTPHKVTIEGIDVLVWDSPGLQDGDANYLENLKSVNSTHGLDVVIYCIKMNDTKFYAEDKMAICKLTEGFGKDVWKKTVIALTFANQVQDPDAEDHDKPANQVYFLEEFTEWERQLRGAPNGILNKLDIDSEVLTALPIVAVGNSTGNPKKPRPLPNGDKWLSELWLRCYSVMSDTAGIALYKISKHRLVSAATAKALEAANIDPTDIPGDIPFTKEQENAFFSRMWESFKRNVPKALTATGFVAVAVIAALFKK